VPLATPQPTPRPTETTATPPLDQHERHPGGLPGSGPVLDLGPTLAPADVPTTTLLAPALTPTPGAVAPVGPAGKAAATATTVAPVDGLSPGPLPAAVVDPPLDQHERHPVVSQVPGVEAVTGAPPTPVPTSPHPVSPELAAASTEVNAAEQALLDLSKAATPVPDTALLAAEQRLADAQATRARVVAEAEAARIAAADADEAAMNGLVRGGLGAVALVGAPEIAIPATLLSAGVGLLGGNVDGAVGDAVSIPVGMVAGKVIHVGGAVLADQLAKRTGRLTADELAQIAAREAAAAEQRALAGTLANTTDRLAEVDAGLTSSGGSFGRSVADDSVVSTYEVHGNADVTVTVDARSAGRAAAPIEQRAADLQAARDLGVPFVPESRVATWTDFNGIQRTGLLRPNVTTGTTSKAIQASLAEALPDAAAQADLRLAGSLEPDDVVDLPAAWQGVTTKTADDLEALIEYLRVNDIHASNVTFSVARADGSLVVDGLQGAAKLDPAKFDPGYAARLQDAFLKHLQEQANILRGIGSLNEDLAAVATP
jgi:hypothetical protein